MKAVRSGRMQSRKPNVANRPKAAPPFPPKLTDVEAELGPAREWAGRCYENEAKQLSIEIVETATGKVEKKLGPYASEHLCDKADDGVNRNLDHERFYTRFAR